MNTEKQAYSVPEFLHLYQISRTKLYELWQEGRGPRSYKIGRKRLVSKSAAEEWQAKMEEQ